jgi:5'-AMP-activated protein kinase regulatory gamma subunit
VTVLDTKLEVRKALTCLVNNGLSCFICLCHSPTSSVQGIVSAPLMNGDTYQFAGMLTVSDFVHLMAYHYANTPNYDDAATNVEKLRLEDLRG